VVDRTLQHDDLHDGNVFVRDGRYLFFDWGTAACRTLSTAWS
jgi:Ser/Thr protein kinase RdoA (MazF antagonist)